tara:strand:+ start:266 stop:604 length:339 start_codon:yes stop_codon:yes gene_type:complete
MPNIVTPPINNFNYNKDYIMPLYPEERIAVSAICKANSLAYDTEIKRPEWVLTHAPKSAKIKQELLNNAALKRNFYLYNTIDHIEFSLKPIIDILNLRKENPYNEIEELVHA